MGSSHLPRGRRVAALACATLIASAALMGCGRDKLDEDGHFEDWIAAHPFTDARLVEAESEYHSFAYESRTLRAVIDVPGLEDWGDATDWARVARARDEVCAYPTQDPETHTVTYLNRFGVHEFHGLDGNGKGDDGLGSLGIGCDTDVPALLGHISTIWQLPHVTAQDQLGSYGDPDLLSDWFRVDDVDHLGTVASRAVASAAAYQPAGRPRLQLSAERRFDLVVSDAQGMRPTDVDAAVALAQKADDLLPRGYVGAVVVTLDGTKLRDQWEAHQGQPPWYLSCGREGLEPCPWRYEIGVMHEDSVTSTAHDADVRRVIARMAEALGATTTLQPGKPLITFGAANYHALDPIAELRAYVEEHPDGTPCCKR
jgi:hypothetical protein